MAEFSLPFHIIPADATPEQAESWRQMMRWMAQEIKTRNEAILRDPRMSNERIASGLHAMQNNVMLDYATRPNQGDVLYCIETAAGYKAAWGASGVPSPSDPGTGPSVGVTAHSDLTGLPAPADDHTQYWLLSGRAGGTTAYGGTAASDPLAIHSTSNATKGTITIGPKVTVGTDGFVGINKTTPTANLDVVCSSNSDIGINVKQNSAAHFSNLIRGQNSSGITVFNWGVASDGYSTLNLGSTPDAIGGAISFSNLVGGTAYLYATDGFVGDEYFLLPDTGGTLVTEGSTNIFTNKTLNNSCHLTAINGSSGVDFRDSVSSTKRLYMNLSGMTAASNTSLAFTSSADRVFTYPNLTGRIPVIGDDPPAVAAGALGKVDSTAQAAAIGSTNLSNGAIAGMYLVDYTLLVTTLDATAGTIQFQTNYTDTLGATNQVGAALALTATGRQSGQFVVQLASGELSYQTNLVTIGGGAARYALYVRVVALG